MNTNAAVSSRTAARRARAVARHMGLVTESMSGLAVNNAAKTKEVDQEKLRLKKEQRKQRREEERRQLGEERVEVFNVDVMAEYVLGSKYRAQRRTVTESVKANAELFPYNFELSKEDQRERVLQQVRWIAAKGWASLDMLKEDPTMYCNSLEPFIGYDGSIAIKAGVHFLLFGGSVVNLGTERHQKWYDATNNLAEGGCFAMTELGHGSNVQGIGTTAVYDKATGEFVINTPTDVDRKWWIGHAAHAKNAVVFAQLNVDGQEHGVHAFVVPLRPRDSNATYPGILIGDCGHKMGLNGVDNGWMKFTNVRVPRENLLNRFADVQPDGQYVSSVKNPLKRFGRQLAALTCGRVCLVSGSSATLSVALTIAVRFAAGRKQFGPPGEPEQPILDYISHQRRLMPMLANCYAYRLMGHYLLDLYKNADSNNAKAIGELHSLSAGVKAAASWYTNVALQVCRESCGGQGYAAYNRFCHLRNDHDIYQTFEGDNTVLMQQVAKDLLTQYKKQFDGKPFSGMLKYLGKQMGHVISESNPYVTNMASWTHLRDQEFQKDAFDYRVARLLHNTAQLLQKRAKNNDFFTAWNQTLPELLHVAEAHVERVVVKQFVRRVNDCPDINCKHVLKLLCDLYALTKIEKDLAVFSKEGYIKKRKANAISELITELCQEVRIHALHLVDAFEVDDFIVHAPLGLKPDGHDPLLRVLNYVQTNYATYPQSS